MYTVLCNSLYVYRDTLEALLIHNIPAAGVSREEFIKVYRTVSALCG